MVYSLAPLAIIAFSCISGFVSEGLCWLFVYRLSSFRRLEATLEKANKRLESAKVAGARVQKKEQRLGDMMKASSAEVFKVQIKTTVITGVTLILFYNILTQLYDGIPVAKLPFEAPRFVQRASHRSLPGDDMTDCAMAFIYMLCATSIRGNLAKLLGLGPSKHIRQHKIFDPAGTMNKNK